MGKVIKNKLCMLTTQLGDGNIIHWKLSNFTSNYFLDSSTKVNLIGPSRLRASDGETVIQCEADTPDSPDDINFQVLVDKSNVS